MLVVFLCFPYLWTFYSTSHVCLAGYGHFLIKVFSWCGQRNMEIQVHSDINASLFVKVLLKWTFKLRDNTIPNLSGT